MSKSKNVIVVEPLDADDESESTTDSLRLLFDQNEPKVVKNFRFNSDISINVVCAEETQPGALQSGVFLWPAAMSLAQYLCDEFDNNWTNVVEYGAGCGLVGLVIGRLLQKRNLPESSVTFTDRDWISLRMIRSSIVECSFPSSIRIKRKRLTWSINNEDGDTTNFTNADLAVGSDLMYSTESALSLLSTVMRTMPVDKPWRFILSSSFRDKETTAIVEAQCVTLNLTRTVLKSSTSSPELIEMYHRT